MYNYFKDKKSLIRTLIFVSFSAVLTAALFCADFWGHYGLNVAGGADVVGLIYIFVGWVYGNHCSNKYYRETGDYGGRLSLEKRQNIMRIRYPLYVSGLLSVLLGEAFHLVVSIIL